MRCIILNLWAGSFWIHELHHFEFMSWIILNSWAASFWIHELHHFEFMSWIILNSWAASFWIHELNFKTKCWHPVSLHLIIGHPLSSDLLLPLSGSNRFRKLDSCRKFPIWYRVLLLTAWWSGSCDISVVIVFSPGFLFSQEMNLKNCQYNYLNKPTCIVFITMVWNIVKI